MPPFPVHQKFFPPQPFLILKHITVLKTSSWFLEANLPLKWLVQHPSNTVACTSVNLGKSY